MERPSRDVSFIESKHVIVFSRQRARLDTSRLLDGVANLEELNKERNGPIVGGSGPGVIRSAAEPPTA